jgi:uncharacterized protein
MSSRSAADEDLIYHPPVEIHSIPSKYVRQTFRIEVMQPARKRTEHVRFPVVYVTDANRSFDMLRGIAHIIQATGRDAPRFILVGIGYQGDSPVAGLVLRARDFTFPGYIRHSTDPPPVDGVLIAEEGTKTFDGATDFHRFIREELIPFIDGRYATVPGERTYFGHSAGGGFGLYTLLTESDLFKRYIVSSPGLAYHGESTAGIRYEHYDFMLAKARAFIAAGKALKGVHLYMSVGAEEESEPALTNWQLTSSFYRMAALLKAAGIPGLQLTTEVFPGETHMTAWPIAFIHGVQAVFARGRWSERYA